MTSNCKPQNLGETKNYKSNYQSTRLNEIFSYLLVHLVCAVTFAAQSHSLNSASEGSKVFVRNFTGTFAIV